MPSKLAAARASREASERLGGGPATAPRRAASGQSGLPSEMEDHSKDDPTKTFARMSQRRRGSLESQPNAQQQHLSAKLATDAPASGQSVTFHVSSGAHGQHGTPTATAAALAGAQAAAAAAAGDASGAAGTPSRSVSPGNTAPAVRPHGALHTLVTPGLGSGHSPRMGSVGRLPSASGSSARLPTMAVGLGPGGVPLRAASAALPDACVGGVVGHAEGSGSALWGGVPETSGSTLPPSSAAFTQPSASQSQLQPAVAMAGHRPELVGAGGGTGGHVLLDSAPEGLAGMAAHNTGTELGMGSVSGTQLQDIVPVSGVSAGGVSGSGGVGGMPGCIQALPSAAIPTAMPATASAAAAAVAAAGARASSGTAFSAAAAAAASVSGEQAWTGSLNTAAPPAAERSKSSSTQATTPVRQSRLRVSVGRQGPEAAGAGAGRVGASGVGAVSTDMSLDAGESLARTSPQPEQLPPGPGLTSPAVAWPTTAARAGSGLSAVSSSAGGTPAGVSRHTSAVGLRHGRTGLAGHGSGTLAASSATAGAGAAGAAARELFHTTSLGPANSGAGVGVGSEEPPSPSVASSFTMRQTPSDVEDELMERMRARGGLGLGLSGARLAAAGGSARMTAGGAAGGGGGAVSVSARPSETGTSGGMAVGLSSAGLLMHTADGAAAVSATAGHLDGGSPAHRLSGGVPPGGYMPSVGERGGGTAAGVRVPIRLNHQPGHQRRLPNRHASMPATKQDSAAAAAVLGAAASHRAAAAAAAAAAARQQQQHDSGPPGELMAADPAVVSGVRESSLQLRVLDVTDVGAVSGQAISGSGAIGGGATGSGEGGHLTSGASHLHLLSHNNSSVLAPGGVSATLSRWAPTSPELCSTGGGGGAAAPGGAAGPALVPVALTPAAAAGSGFGMRGAVGSGTGAGGMGNGVSALIGSGGGLSPIRGGPHQLPSPPEAESEPYDTQLVMRPPPPGGRMPQLRHALGGGGDRGGTDDGSAAAGVPGGGGGGGGGGSSSRATPAFLGGRSASGSGNNGRALASAMAAATATGGGSGQQHQVPQALMSSQQSGFFVDRPSHPSGRMLMSGAHATAAAAAAHNSGLAALHKAVERLMLQDSGLYSKVQASMKGISSLAKETNKLEFVRDASGATVINQYVVVKTLGRGAFGKVKLCLNTLDGQLYAVKMINRAHLLRQLQKPARPLRRRAPPPRNTSDTGLMHGVMHRTATESNLSICNTNGSSFGNVAQAALPARASMDDASPLAAIMREIAVMKKVDHPHVVRLHEVIDPPGSNYLMMVMEYCEGGCVMETRQQTGLAPLGEEAARESFRQACLGLDYLHYNNVVHGDMKPENMLVSGSGVLKIADFGSSRFMGGDPGDATKTSCTPAFQSPEEISHLPVDPFAADVWALGCCLYTFVFGRLPFVGSCVVDIYRAILTRPHTYPSPAELPHSPELRDLLDRMLHKDPARRLQLKDVMQHPWVTGHGTLPPLVCLQTLAATIAAANQFSIGGAAGGTDGGASPGAAAAAAPPAVVLPPVIRVTHAEQVNAIDRSSLVSLIRARLKEKICSPGEYLFKEGDEAHCVYMIMAGVVELTQHLRRPPPGYPGGGTSAGPAGERRGAAAVAAAAAAAAASGSGDPDHDHDASFSVDLDESLTLDHMEGMHFTDAMNIVDGKLHIDRQQAIEMRRRMQGQLLGDNAEYVVEVKGPGSVIGEMGMEATATVTHRMSARARGPVTVVKLTEENFFKALLQMYGGGGGGGSQASTSITASSISEALTKANGGGGGGGAHGGAPPPAPSSYAGSGAGGPGGGAPGLSAQHLMVMQYLEDSGSHAMFGPTGAPLGGGGHGHGHGGGHVSGTAGGRYSLDSAARPTLVRPGVVGGVGSGASVHPLNAAAAVQSSLYAAGSPVRAAGSPLGLGPGAGGGAQGAAGVQWVAVSGAGVAAGGAAGGGPGSGHHHPHHHHNHHHQQGAGARSNGGSAHGGGAPAFSAAAVDRFGRGGAAPRVPPGATFGGGGSGGEEGAAPMGLGAGAVAAHRAMALLGGASKSSLNAHSHLGVLNTIHSINASRAGGNTSEEGIADL